jgi:hypothetical protein
MDIPALTSRIEAVTVFSCGAAVTRRAELAPAGGAWPAQVRLTGLPLSLDDGSVKVRVEGSDGTAPSAVGLRVALEAPDVPAPEPPDEEALRGARREVLRLRARVGDCDRLATRLNEMALPERPEGKEGEPPPASPHAARLGLLEFQQERLAALAEQKRDLDRQRHKAEERMADLLDRKRRASTAREARENELRKTVVVALRPPAAVAAAAPARLVLEYQVPGARWAPSYVLRFEKDWSRVALAMRASVAQRTGEDWRGVRLTLSTADLQAWTELPEMKAIRIGRAQPPPRSGWRPAPVGAEALYMDFDREAVPVTEAPEEPEPAAEEEQAEGAPERQEAQAKDKADRRRGAPQPSQRPVPPPAPMPKKAMAPPRAQMLPPAPCAPAPASAPMGAAMSLSRAARSDDAMMDRECAKSAPMEAEECYNGAGAGGAPPEPEPLGPGGWLDYGRLRMPGPAEGGRGRLARADEASVYLELLARLQVKVRFDVVATVRSARDSAEDLGDLPPEHNYPSVSGGFDYAFPAEPPAEIPSDGQFHSIPLLGRDATAKMWYVTVPREAPDAFRFAEVVNPLDAPLLEGPADVYAGGEFLMTVPLSETAPRGLLKLGLGVEQAVKVARNTTFTEETAGLMGGTLNLRHEIRIEVRSLLAATVQVEVRERVPSTHEKEENIKVAVTGVTPPWEAYDPEGEGLKGGHRWLVPVKPGETAQLRAAYTVTIPAKMELADGNRRER